MDRKDYRGQAVPVGNNSNGKQGGTDHLGNAYKERGIPAASVLTA